MQTKLVCGNSHASEQPILFTEYSSFKLNTDLYNLMSSIVTAALEATIGLLLNKGRDKLTESLKGGDVTNETVRNWIVREINAVSSKLNGLARKDLNTSINHFRTGLVYLFEVLKKTQCGDDGSTAEHNSVEMDVNHSSYSLPSSVTAVNIPETLNRWKLADLNDADNRALSNAKEGFKEAGRKATEAFSNEELETVDRIQAMVIRVAARILENVDHPTDALAACKLCLQDLHSMPAVQNNFKVALDSGFRAGLGWKKRRKIIANVCRVNRAIYDVMLNVGEAVDLERHCVDVGKETLVDTLRDVRVTKALLKSDIAECCVTPRLLGQEGDKPESKLKMPQGITTNRQGHFIVGDNKDRNVKVFDRSGKFVKYLRPLPHGKGSELSIRDVATDRQDNIYVLVKLQRATGFPWYAVYVSDTNANLDHKFTPKKGGSRGCKMTISGKDKVLVLRKHYRNCVDVYEIDGQFLCSFGAQLLKDALAITAVHDGRVLVADKDGSHVHVFSEMGTHLKNFQVEGFYFSLNIAFYQSSAQHIVVAGKKNVKNYPRLNMLIYTVEGKLVRTIELDGKGIDHVSRVTVSREGRFAIVYHGSQDSEKVVIV